ncbi:MAG: uroporphyrinogen-III synthase [Elusimicrobiota bacterium]
MVTRPRALSGSLAAALRSRGARVVFAPLIKTVTPRSWRALDAALRGLCRYDAVVFASANAVDAFFTRARTLLRKRPMAPPLVAAVGPATEKALNGYGWRPSVVPEDARAEGLAAALRLRKGSRVLIPRAERGREALPRILRQAGARVTLATAYRTLSDHGGRRILRNALAGGAHAVLFASPSAVKSAANALGRARMKTVFLKIAAVAIGPTTTAALKACGVRPAAVAQHPDAESFALAASKALS